MATTLKNIVQFVGVPAGGTVSLPHGLKWSPPASGDLPQIPDIIEGDAAGFDATADDTDVTVTNNGVAAADINVLCELWHTIERAFGDAAIVDLTPRPFVVMPDGSGAVVRERELVPENWQQQDIPAAQAATAMETGVSQLFADYQAIRAGSLIGINLRFTAALAAGTATAVATINGVATACLVIVAAGASSGRAVFAAGVIPYVAGDLIGVTLATSAGFLPSGSLDAEVSLEVNAA